MNDVKFGEPGKCPKCDNYNPSGFVVPKDCIYCNDGKSNFGSSYIEKVFDSEWKINEDTMMIINSDFTYDIGLHLSGDCDNEIMKKILILIASKLNG